MSDGADGSSTAVFDLTPVQARLLRVHRCEVADAQKRGPKERRLKQQMQLADESMYNQREAHGRGGVKQIGDGMEKPTAPGGNCAPSGDHVDRGTAADADRLNMCPAWKEVTSQDHTGERPASITSSLDPEEAETGSWPVLCDLSLDKNVVFTPLTGALNQR